MNDYKSDDERALFEKWWVKEMGDRMKGSKYLARNAWLAALWEYEVKTSLGIAVVDSDRPEEGKEKP